ncbi:MAG: LysM peptidoglycan-binding domain-containing protein [Omnitrophica bacterium]|nr:LysM peptidoglycan-binding domain-containing protein [Candidatus Omnitrophota bacterium]
MKKLWFLVIAIFLSGCMTVRSYVVEKPRTDLDIDGNQGYLSGTPKAGPRENKLGDTRKVSVVEIEFGPRRHYKDKPRRREVGDIDIVDEDVFRDDLAPVKSRKVVSVKPPVSKKKYKYYIVKKNDTLQKISYKFYKTTKKWKFIYDNNKRAIKDPNKVYPGTKIKIPL